MSFRLVALLFTMLLLGSCATMHAKTPDLAGQWTPAHAELGGKDFPVANFAGAKLNLTADTYEFGGDRGKVAIVSSAPPAAMDIHGEQGPNAGRTIRAIFEHKGNELTICYQLGPGERPKEFVSPAGSMVLLVKYTRP